MNKFSVGQRCVIVEYLNGSIVVGAKGTIERVTGSIEGGGPLYKLVYDEPIQFPSRHGLVELPSQSGLFYTNELRCLTPLEEIAMSYEEG